MNLRKSIPWWSPAALLLVIVLAAVINTAKNHGYRWTLAPDQEASDSPNRVLRVSPAKLFTGELKRLEPHFNLTASGCVRLEAPGPELFVGTEIEFWENGKAKYGGKGMSLVKDPEEASFSLREVTDEKGQRKLLFITAVSARSGGYTSAEKLDIPEVATFWSQSELLSEPRELQEGEEVAVWASVFPVRDGHSFIHISGVEEAAKAAQWALVVKVYWERTKDHDDPTRHLP